MSEYTNKLAEQMLGNTLSGAEEPYMVRLGRRSTTTPQSRGASGSGASSSAAAPASPTKECAHILQPFGQKLIKEEVNKKGGKKRKAGPPKFTIQRSCKICRRRTSTYCSAVGCGMAICQDGTGRGGETRYCLSEHKRERRSIARTELGCGLQRSPSTCRR